MQNFAGQSQGTDSPAWRPEYWNTYLMPLWQRVCDCYHGVHTDDLKRRYLRQQLGEHDKVYKARIETVAFENRLSPSVKSHAGLLSDFRLTEDTPESVREAQNDIDGQGNSLESALLDWDIDALLYNAAMGLVDVPIAEDGNTRQEPKPRLIPIPIKDVYAPKVSLVDGVLTISQISIRRSVSVADGAFGSKVKDRFWVYKLTDAPAGLRKSDGSEQRYVATFELWEEPDAENGPGSINEPELIQASAPIKDASGRPLDLIPIVWYSPYGDPVLFTGVDDMYNRGGTPEYMSLVDLNFEYFNKHSEINTAESRSNFVMLMMKYPGAAPETQPDMTTGGRILVLEGGATLEMLEPAGTALGSTREGQDRRLQRMDAIAQSFLTGGDVARTATEALIDSSQSRLGLRNIARRKESAVQQIFYWWERYSNPGYREGDPVGGITVSEAVLTMPASPQELQFWSGEFLNGNLTRAEYRAKLRELGAYTEDMAEAEKEAMTGGMQGLGLTNQPKPIAAVEGITNGNGI
jgi:hypothetical protein